jgi:hypothetical protein
MKNNMKNINNYDDFLTEKKKRKKDPNAPKFGTPEYWAYLKNKKSDDKDGKKSDGKDGKKSDGKDGKKSDDKDDKKSKKNPNKFGTPEFFKWLKDNKKK